MVADSSVKRGSSLLHLYQAFGAPETSDLLGPQLHEAFASGPDPASVDMDTFDDAPLRPDLKRYVLDSDVQVRDLDLAGNAAGFGQPGSAHYRPPLPKQTGGHISDSLLDGDVMKLEMSEQQAEKRRKRSGHYTLRPRPTSVLGSAQSTEDSLGSHVDVFKLDALQQMGRPVPNMPSDQFAKYRSKPSSCLPSGACAAPPHAAAAPRPEQHPPAQQQQQQLQQPSYLGMQGFDDFVAGMPSGDASRGGRMQRPPGGDFFGDLPVSTTTAGTASTAPLPILRLDDTNGLAQDDVDVDDMFDTSQGGPEPSLSNPSDHRLDMSAGEDAQPYVRRQRVHGLPEDLRRERRRQSNRESARRSRARKIEEVKTYENRIARLNASLQMRQQQLEQSMTQVTQLKRTVADLEHQCQRSHAQLIDLVRNLSEEPATLDLSDKVQTQLAQLRSSFDSDMSSRPAALGHLDADNPSLSNDDGHRAPGNPRLR